MTQFRGFLSIRLALWNGGVELANVALVLAADGLGLSYPVDDRRHVDAQHAAVVILSLLLLLLLLAHLAHGLGREVLLEQALEHVLFARAAVAE